MPGAHLAGAYPQGGRMHLGDAEQVQRRGDTDSVDDGVHPADLVQVHLTTGTW
jgi:hypothetical protein